jgi:hypothetical protein
MTTIRTWLDGRVQDVQADDPQLVEQEATRVRMMHVANMRRLDLRGRRDYLANVERREGLPHRIALQDAFGADWEARRAKA